ncbi:hypothetical protein CON37_26085 [Bacillus cereus]|nr:hypothetical protein CON37_26085 [Bacillus cereus]
MDGIENGVSHPSLKDSNGNQLINNKEYYIQPYENPEAKLDIFIQQNGDYPWTPAKGPKMKVKFANDPTTPYVAIESSSVSYTYQGEGIDKGPVWGLLGARLTGASTQLGLKNLYKFAGIDDYDYTWRIEGSKYPNYYSVSLSGRSASYLEYQGLNNYVYLKHTSDYLFNPNAMPDSLQWTFVPAE